MDLSINDVNPQVLPKKIAGWISVVRSWRLGSHAQALTAPQVQLLLQGLSPNLGRWLMMASDGK